MSAYKLLDFKDIYEAIAAELKLQLSDTTSLNRIKRVVNMVYLDEVSPRARWFWLQGHSVIRHKITYSSGTCSVLPNTTTVTLTVPPAVTSGDNGSFKGWYFSIDGQNETYRISSHAAEAATFILDAPYNGNSASGVAFKIYQENVPLPTDCRETVEVYYDHQATPLVGRGLQEFRKIQTSAPKTIGRPAYYCTYDFQDPTDETAETEADRYRILKVWPAISQYTTILKVDYIKDVDALDLDGDEPLMPVEDRIVLYYGALSILWSSIGRNPEESARNKSLYEDKLARMMGKVTDSMDKPRVEPESTYITAKRGPRIGVYSRKGLGPGASGGSTYNSPTYLENVTINGATITANVGVNPGITIDGRDVSADGNTLDSHVASEGDVHGAIGGLVGLDNVQVITKKTIDAADNTISNISDANISASAAIAVGKLAALTASKAVVTDASGILTASTVTSAEVGHLAGVTSSIQPQLESIASHIADTTDAHNASAISVTPAGNLAAVEVQEALEELQADVDTRAPAATAVTLTGVQVITNKDYDGGTASDTSRITLPKASKATLDALTRKQGTLVYDTSTNKPYFDDGTSLKVIGSGSGGIKNFLTNGDSESGVTGWTAFNSVRSSTAADSVDATVTTGGHGLPLGIYVQVKVLTVAVACGLTAGNIYYANAYTANHASFHTAPGALQVNITADSAITWAETRPAVPYGTANITWGVTTTNPLSDAKSFLLTKDAANRQYQGVMTDFTIDNAYKAKVLNTYMDYIVDSGTFVAGSNTTDSDVIVYLYDVTNNQVIEPSSYKLLSNSTTIADRYSSSFQTPYNSTSYRLVILVASTSTAAYALKMDNVGVSPSNYVYGTPITDWVSYTPTYTNAPTGNSSFKWRRIGDSIQIDGLFTATASGPAGTFTISLPSGLEVDTTKISNVYTSQGVAKLFDSGVSNYTGVSSWSTSPKGITIQLDGAGNIVQGTTFTVNDNVSVNIMLPILGWTSSVQVSDGYDGRVVAASYGLATSAAVAQEVLKLTTPIAVDTIGAYDTVTGRYNVKTSGKYKVQGQIIASSSGATALIVRIRKNGVSTYDGIAPCNAATSNLVAVTGGVIDLVAGDYVELYSDYTVSNLTHGNSSAATFLSIEKLAGNPVISATDLVAVRASNIAGTSIAAGGGSSNVPYATVALDTHGAWNGTTFTAPIAGVYEVKQHAYFNSASWAVSGKSLQVFKNGGNYSYLTLYIPPTTYTEALGMEGSDLVPLNAGETISFVIQHNEGTARSLSTVGGTNYISIKRVK